ncbi:Aldo/keto reductase [Thozetella sp. PMI_491]|nr:Aldo/keto reductase [Thozetella sp. PMI_491]
MSPVHPVIHYGTTTFGSSQVPTLQDESIVSEFLDAVRSTGIAQIDTGARYPPDNYGGSERILGAVKAPSKGFTVNTKILFTGNNSDGALSKEAVRKSVKNSLKNLGVDKVGVLYAHIPDNVTPLEEQAEAFNEQYQAGYCEKIGISNFPSDMLESFLDICENKGYVKPSVYQGPYNIIFRDAEDKLFPLLRKHNITFNAYSPLAAGFLTGNLTSGRAEGTRLGSPYGAHFRGWYDKAEFHAAIRNLMDVIDPRGIKPTEAALRWLAYHSPLTEKDGIILGATKVEQIQENMVHIAKGPLPADIVAVINRIKDTVGEATKSIQIDPSILAPK